MNDMFFNGWDTLIRTLVVGTLAYCALVLFLRVSGKRTLSKMNAFDWVVTVALGSTLATTLLNKNVSLAQGALALALLIVLQFLVTWSSVRAKWVRKMIAAEPSLMVYQGEYLEKTMHRERVTKEDVLSAIRSSGNASIKDVGAVILDTDGTFAVVQKGAETGLDKDTLK
ncbi:MAG: YetF domain-containing protein [Idiomarina sp.]